MTCKTLKLEAADSVVLLVTTQLNGDPWTKHVSH